MQTAEELLTLGPLTRARTRASLQTALHDEMERANRQDTHLSVLLIDLDYLKSINDAFGHARGDAVLVEQDRIIADLRSTSATPPLPRPGSAAGP